MPKVSNDELTCTKCGKEFDCKRYLQKHTKRVHSEARLKESLDSAPRSLECLMCGKQFLRLSHLQRHQLTHLNIRDWKCPFCDEKFVQKAHVVRHIARWHPNESTKDLDNRICADQPEANDDETIVQLETDELESTEFPTCSSLVTRFDCAVCSSTFTDSYALNRHMDSTHKAIVCHHCDQTFYGATALKDHELLIRGELYECRCGASFSTPRNLRNHEGSCHGRGTFVCLECGQVFVQRVQLDRHWKREHFGMVSCAECEWTAEAPLRMTEHMREKHGKDICGYCGIRDPASNHVSETHWNRLRRPESISRNLPKEVSSLSTNVAFSGSLVSMTKDLPQISDDSCKDELVWAPNAIADDELEVYLRDSSHLGLSNSHELLAHFNFDMVAAMRFARTLAVPQFISSDEKTIVRHSMKREKQQSAGPDSFVPCQRLLPHQKVSDLRLFTSTNAKTPSELAERFKMKEKRNGGSGRNPSSNRSSSTTARCNSASVKRGTTLQRPNVHHHWSKDDVVAMRHYLYMYGNDISKVSQVTKKSNNEIRSFLAMMNA